MSEKSNIENLINEKGCQFRDFRINLTTRAADEEGSPEHHIIEGKPIVYDSETSLYKFRDYNGYDVDLREVIDPHALDDADMSKVLFNFNHCGRVFAKFSDKCHDLNLEKRADCLYMSTELWADDEGHMQLYRDIKRSHLDQMSFAFTIAESERIETVNDEDMTRSVTYRVTKIGKLYDVSVVDLPAYDATEISARRIFGLAEAKKEAASINAASVARAKFKYKSTLNNKF